ncbi:hypothetical protein Tco_0186594, partial [Tanacetum coccineum]
EKMNKVDIENLTIEQYFRLAQEKQTLDAPKINPKSIINKKVEDMTIAEYVEYKKQNQSTPRLETRQVHRYPQNLEFDKHLSHSSPIPFVDYFIPRKINFDEGEAESNKNIDSWIKAEVGERMDIKSMDKGEAIFDVIRTLVEECKAVCKQNNQPLSSQTSEI